MKKIIDSLNMFVFDSIKLWFYEIPHVLCTIVAIFLATVWLLIFAFPVYTIMGYPMAEAFAQLHKQTNGERE